MVLSIALGGKRYQRFRMSCEERIFCDFKMGRRLHRHLSIVLTELCNSVCSRQRDQPCLSAVDLLDRLPVLVMFVEQYRPEATGGFYFRFARASKSNEANYYI